MAFRSVLVANRGEIAVRVIRTLRAMGIRSVAVFTDADAGALHARVADSAVGIGPSDAYLDVDAVVSAAVRSGADALHPGYGFLSENPALAEACREAGVVFIGPPPEAIRAMGDKINAKELVSSAGVPVVPGLSGRSLDDAGLADAAIGIGLPVLLKPSAGGGGKGMRRVDSPDQLRPSIEAARREAMSAFGDGTLLVERYLPSPRHIEIQVIADTHGNVVALGERECTLQRRHQKIVEEAPSPVLDPATRAAMEGAAVAAARACGYSGAGTVEFIVAGDKPHEFYFMEMNTRLQVEHPVTELVRGLDLVEWQVRVATGERLPWSDPPPARGHAIEARLYAEDPAHGFLPSTGTVVALREPSGEGVRVDSALYPGTVIGVDYDPMLAKVIAWGATRQEAITRLREALRTTVVAGLRTNVGFLVRLLDHPDVVAGNLDTGLVDRTLGELITRPDAGRIVAVAALIHDAERSAASDHSDPWQILDGWRLSGPVPRRSRWSLDGQETEVKLSGDPLRAATVSWGHSGPAQARLWLDGAADPSTAMVEIDGDSETYVWAAEAGVIWLSTGGDTWAVEQVTEAVGAARGGPTGGGSVTSPMPGTVLAVHVGEGAEVKRGDPIVTVEAMKMEHTVTAPADATVVRVLVSAGQAVALGELLAELEGADDE